MSNTSKISAVNYLARFNGSENHLIQIRRVSNYSIDDEKMDSAQIDEAIRALLDDDRTDSDPVDQLESELEEEEDQDEEDEDHRRQKKNGKLVAVVVVVLLQRNTKP